MVAVDLCLQMREEKILAFIGGGPLALFPAAVAGKEEEAEEQGEKSLSKNKKPGASFVDPPPAVSLPFPQRARRV